MELTIKNLNTTETFKLEIKVTKNQKENIYEITFLDKRLSDRYGTIKIIQRENDFWKFPDNSDSYLMGLVSETIFRLTMGELEN